VTAARLCALCWTGATAADRFWHGAEWGESAGRQE
jgi:purine nucleoside permease